MPRATVQSPYNNPNEREQSLNWRSGRLNEKEKNNKSLCYILLGIWQQFVVIYTRKKALILRDQCHSSVLTGKEDNRSTLK